MKTNWPVKKLGEVVNILNGYAFKSTDYKSGGIKLLRMSNITREGTLNFNFKNTKYLDKKFLGNYKKFILNENDLVVAMTDMSKELGIIGKVTKVTNFDDILLNQRVGKFEITNRNIDQGFLYYVLLDAKFKRFVESLCAGGLQYNVSASQILKYQISTPTLLIQKKIVERLDAIRKVQELCDQQIQKTEELFESFLVNEFKNQKEWKKKKLPEVSNVQRGKFTPRPRNDPKYFGGDTPWIQTGDITNSDGTINNYTQTLNEEGLRVSRIFPKGTIVITIAANIGDLAILEIDAAFPDSIVGIRANKSVINNKFLYFQMLLQKDYLNNQATQAAQRNINLQVLSKVKIKVPSLIDQQKIVEKLEAVQNYKKLLLKQKELLKELFDSVLDKSMKGELD